MTVNTTVSLILENADWSVCSLAGLLHNHTCMIASDACFTRVHLQATTDA